MEPMSLTLRGTEGAAVREGLRTPEDHRGTEWSAGVGAREEGVRGMYREIGKLG